MGSPSDLAATLLEVSEPEYVRFVADWLIRADGLDEEPTPTGNRVVDALTAAATAHVAMLRGESIPLWTNGPGRHLDELWYPGPAGLFAYALVHSPLAFANRGVLIEANSLESV